MSFLAHAMRYDLFVVQSAATVATVALAQAGPWEQYASGFFVVLCRLLTPLSRADVVVLIGRMKSTVHLGETTSLLLGVIA